MGHNRNSILLVLIAHSLENMEVVANEVHHDEQLVKSEIESLRRVNELLLDENEEQRIRLNELTRSYVELGNELAAREDADAKRQQMLERLNDEIVGFMKLTEVRGEVIARLQDEAYDRKVKLSQQEQEIYRLKMEVSAYRARHGPLSPRT